MRCLALFFFAAVAVGLALAQVDPALFGGLHWRLAGPFRGGRALAVCGLPGSPESFYFGSVGGGVWFSENAGRTWAPVFDKVDEASIGAIAVAPSDPNVVYVGTGEADMRSDIQQGKGMYKSTDAGKTWTHIGLDDTRQIGKILVDPRDPNTVYVAALGHQYGPNAERGVFKTTDGGQTWTKVLYKNPDTGAIDLAMDPNDSSVIYASLWQTRRPPWSIYPPSNGPGSGLYKSTDAGATWTQIVGNGFPSRVGRIGIAISPADSNRVYACVDALNPREGGVYRSDDGGANWTHTDGDNRIWGRGWYFMGITADPKDTDEVYIMNTSAYRSIDGGHSFIPFKGAPGGDDYHTCWIGPDDPKRMILGSDQGVVVSVDGGKSWSSWYNQPTGQFYHVVTDNRFPYWIYGAQQDSGAMAIPSRTIHTGISALYQRPIQAGGESGTVAPDPLHPGVLYSNSGSKESMETGENQNVDPTMLSPETSWRNTWTLPVVFSPANPHVLYTSHQQIFRSSDGGSTWKIISPDLTRPASPLLANLDPTTAADNPGTARRGVVYWLAPSPLRAKELWAGTDDGLIWLTRDDGRHWSNVTPSALTPWSKVGIIDASHFSAYGAYAAIDRHRLDDNRPYIYRTRDGGKHWDLITNGIPQDQFVNVVREDPKQKGLLYAGTDWGVYVSFDDGARWQPLQLNLPAASVRDIVFGGDDVVVGTHGRAIWILDDVSMLRQMAAGLTPMLYKPAVAIPFHRAGGFGFGRFDEGTPLPPEEPQGENAPWGAIIDYTADPTSQPIVLKVFDVQGHMIRRIASDDPVARIDPRRLDIPAYWIQPPQVLAWGPGAYRYLWDFRYRTAGGPLVPPGRYVVQLTENGKSVEQPLVVERDPRVHATDAELRAQYRFALEILDEQDKVLAARDKALAGLSRVQATKIRAITGSGPVRRRRRGEAPTANSDFTSLTYVAGALGGLEGAVESGPGVPARQCRVMFARLKRLEAADMVKLERLEKANRR